MVEPIDAQNMLAKTPAVEKTVAAHRENLNQQQVLANQLQKERTHEGDNVNLQREAERTEDKLEKQKKQDLSDKKKEQEKQQDQQVEWVEDSPDDPDHELDVTI